MSWLNDLWTNATTGNLTESQKAGIAQASTSLYTPGGVPCSNGDSRPECQSLLADNQLTVDYVATMNDTCDGVLSVPVIGCISSWTNVILWFLALLFAVGVLYHVTINKLSR